MNFLGHYADLLLNRPLLCTPEYAETVASVLGERIGIDATDLRQGTYSAGPGEVRLVAGDTLVVPVVGSLTHRPMAMDAMSGNTSYGALQATIEDAMSSGDVKSILLDVDSSGGVVNGVFDFADFLLDQRDRKPIYAIARDTMASAAYLIGSSADKIFTTQTAGVGSIGVVMMHVDRSEQAAMAGIKPTFIFAGSQKVAGNAFEPLNKGVRADLQEKIDDAYDLFVSAVSVRRGLSADAIRSTEARMFDGSKSVEARLADGVVTFDGLINDLAASGPRRFPSMSLNHEDTMNEEELRAEGASAERDRIKAILGHDKAKGRTGLAQHLAFTSQMTADEAVGILAASPSEAGTEAAPKAATPAVQPPASGASVRTDAGGGADEIAELKAKLAASEAKTASLSALASEAAGVEGDPDAGEVDLDTDKAQNRRAEARANARVGLGRRARKEK